MVGSLIPLHKPTVWLFFVFSLSVQAVSLPSENSVGDLSYGVDGFEKTAYLRLDCTGASEGPPFSITVNGQKVSAGTWGCSELDRPQYTFSLGKSPVADLEIRMGGPRSMLGYRQEKIRGLGVHRVPLFQSRVRLTIGIAATLKAPH
ncbi:MAG TPA: hypothetical protein VI874_04425, partial [Candidatus Norongarragalinales archaeon]|nr:hypothetical protein [Candidatus Norongarragalinales archaeon]